MISVDSSPSKTKSATATNDNDNENDAATEAAALKAALAEIQTLPASAQDILAPWVSQVEARNSALTEVDAMRGAIVSE